NVTSAPKLPAVREMWPIATFLAPLALAALLRRLQDDVDFFAEAPHRARPDALPDDPAGLRGRPGKPLHRAELALGGAQRPANRLHLLPPQARDDASGLRLDAVGERALGGGPDRRRERDRHRAGFGARRRHRDDPLVGFDREARRRNAAEGD